MSTPSYFVSKDVYPCFTNEHFVFLDLKQDLYFGLDRRSSRAVAPLLAGWQSSSGAAADRSGMEWPPGRQRVLASPVAVSQSNFEAAIGRGMDQVSSVQHAVDTLIEQGLITTEASCGKEALQACIELPTESLLSDAPVPLSRLGMPHVVGFALAATRAAAKLRWRSIAHIVAAVRARKQRADNFWDLDRARELVGVFSGIRPLLPKSYTCLFDSLAALEFLALYDMYPTWVFGVKVDPFEAHCWTQEGNVVLTDSVDAVRNFTPILTV